MRRITHRFSALVLATTSVGLAFTLGILGVWYTHRDLHTLHARTSFPYAFTLAPNALLARAAVVYDPQTGKILFAKNATTPLPLASLTKIMTAQVVLDAISPNTSVTIRAKDLTPEGDWGLRPGDTLSIQHLLELGLVASSNDAMAAVAASLGDDYLTAMNQTAVAMGLTKTSFQNPTGLDIDKTTAGAYSSALDMAQLTSLFFKKYPGFFSLTTQHSVTIPDSGRTLSSPATDAPLLDIPGLLGAKTGYTDLAGGNLVTVFDVEIGHPLVAVVLGSSRDGRFEDMRTLITAARTTSI